MVDTDKKETVLENWIRKLKNHRAIAAIIIFSAVVTGLGSVTESFDKLIQVFSESDKEKTQIPQSPEDTRIEKMMIGTWKLDLKPPAPSGVDVNDFHFTFFRNGTVNWGGVFSIQEHPFPIIMSGRWSIKDGEMHYEVTSSNVPLVAKEGFSSGSKIIDITNKKMTFIDLLDGKTKVALRVE